MPAFSVVVPVGLSITSVMAWMPLAVMSPAEVMFSVFSRVVPTKPLKVTLPVPAATVRFCAPSTLCAKVTSPLAVTVFTVTSPSRTRLPVNDTASLLVLMVVVLALMVVPVRLTVLAEVMFAPAAMLRLVVAFRLTTPLLEVTRLLFNRTLPDWILIPSAPLVSNALLTIELRLVVPLELT